MKKSEYYRCTFSTCDCHTYRHVELYICEWWMTYRFIFVLIVYTSSILHDSEIKIIEFLVLYYMERRVIIWRAKYYNSTYVHTLTTAETCLIVSMNWDSLSTSAVFTVNLKKNKSHCTIIKHYINIPRLDSSFCTKTVLCQPL